MNRNSLGNARGTGGMAAEDPGDSVASGPSAHIAEAPVEAKAAKICCMCGRSVSGEKRFKDAAGRYWCYECGSADNMRKHPAKCPDCTQMFPMTDLVEYEGTHLCQACSEKRHHAAKRAAARIAAIEAEAREEQARRKKMAIGAAVAAGMIAVLGVAYFLL